MISRYTKFPGSPETIIEINWPAPELAYPLLLSTSGSSPSGSGEVFLALLPWVYYGFCMSGVHAKYTTTSKPRVFDIQNSGYMGHHAGTTTDDERYTPVNQLSTANPAPLPCFAAFIGRAGCGHVSFPQMVSRSFVAICMHLQSFSFCTALQLYVFLAYGPVPALLASKAVPLFLLYCY